MKPIDSDIQNPFASAGSIVYDAQFIGRETDLRVLEDNVLHLPKPRNLAIIGLRRIGKSSLAYHAIIRCKEDLIAKRLLPIWINMATFSQASDFFSSLVTACYYELKDLDLLLVEIEHAAQRFLQDTSPRTGLYPFIQRFFRKVYQSNIQVLFILDEFDSAKHLFQDGVSEFQVLRELAYNPDCGVSLLTISLFTIQEIERSTSTVSSLDGIFMKHYLSMYNRADIHEFFSRLSSLGIIIDLKIRYKDYVNLSGWTSSGFNVTPVAT